MKRLLNYWSGLSSHTLLLLLVLMLTAGCSGTPLSLLTGGGPNVAANTQIGKENNQGINTTIDKSVRPVARPEGPVDTIDQSTNTTNNTEIDPLLLLLLVLGWILPTPNQIGKGLLNFVLMLFGRKNSTTRNN